MFIKAKFQSDGIPEKLKLIILVRVDLHNKALVGDTWSPTTSVRTFKFLMSYSVKHKSRVHQLDCIG